MPAPAPFHPDVTAALAAIETSFPARVFFVACGGSLSIMYPAKFLLDQHSALPSDLFNAAEFTTRAPKGVGKDSLVILCSMTGTTKETVAAAEFARSRQARTVGLTVEPNSPLSKACDHTIGFEAPYTTGVPIDAKNSNYARIYQLVMGVVALTGGEDLSGPLMASLSSLQPAIDKAQEKFAPLFAEYAPRFAKEDVVYTVASGANFGAAYSFAICVLMEMLWIGSQAIHANEFFHGPFEVLDKDRCFILLKGRDSTRSLEDRADTFLHRFGTAGNILVLDAETLDLSGIDPAFRGNLVPLIFFDTLWRFAYRLADLRQHTMLEDRRYMKKITY
ncbi:MAG: sugar isomerase [Cereibacter sphaeroides]|uniref:Sugar isomerase n=1 Tax=Cereibacter sphaeroides TaxID=1063 RepID=A0A2W5SAD3_CERSP|nr:MAG: sugar isomerase [Cereibacter sphaeroides]